MKTLTMTVERAEPNEFFGRLTANGDLLTSTGNTEQELITNMRDLIGDFLDNEWRNLPEFESVDSKNIVIELEYDIVAFFERFDSIKINAIATLAGMNKSLLRQYATGAKFPSAKQVKRIEGAIHQIGQQLTQVVLA